LFCLGPEPSRGGISTRGPDPRMIGAQRPGPANGHGLSGRPDLAARVQSRGLPRLGARPRPGAVLRAHGDLGVSLAVRAARISHHGAPFPSPITDKSPGRLEGGPRGRPDDRWVLGDFSPRRISSGQDPRRGSWSPGATLASARSPRGEPGWPSPTCGLGSPVRPDRRPIIFKGRTYARARTPGRARLWTRADIFRALDPRLCPRLTPGGAGSTCNFFESPYIRASSGYSRAPRFFGITPKLELFT
jgi:hypothetical protein